MLLLLTLKFYLSGTPNHFIYVHKGVFEPFNVKVCVYLQFYRGSIYSFYQILKGIFKSKEFLLI